MALVVKNLSANAGDVRDVDLLPGLGRSHGRGRGSALQYFCLENLMDRGACQDIVHKGYKESGMIEVTHTHTHTHIII